MITTPAIATLVWLIRLTSAFQFLELAAYDQFIRWRSPEPKDERIILVGIEDLGQGAIDDGTYADLLTKIEAMNPRVVGLDIYRDIAVEPGHAALVEVFKKYDNIIGIEKVVGRSRTEKVPPPPVLKEKGQVGFNDLVIDPDGRIRRALVSLNDAEGATIYSWPLYLAYHYLAADGIAGEAAPGTDDWLQFGAAILEPIEANSGSYVGLDAKGYQIFINYRGGLGSFQSVSINDVLAGNVKRENFEERLVMIGDFTEVGNDLFSVPHALSPQLRMPGVEVHAHIASQILSGAFGDRPLIRTWSEGKETLWIFFWTGVGATLTWGLRNTGQGKVWSWERFFGLGGGLTMLVGSSYYALSSG